MPYWTLGQKRGESRKSDLSADRPKKKAQPEGLSGWAFIERGSSSLLEQSSVIAITSINQIIGSLGSEWE